MEWQQYQDCDKQSEALKQLLAMGYEVTKSTFYRHCAQGVCRKNEQGLYSRRMLSDYVEAQQIKRTGETAGGDGGPDIALSLEKQRQENRKLMLDNEAREIKLARLRGQSIDREALHLEFAARLVVLDAGFEQHFLASLPEFIAIAHGDSSRQPELGAAMRRTWDAMMNRFGTTDEFEVLFDGEDEVDQYQLTEGGEE